MMATHVRHGDLVVEFESDGSVKIVRQSTMEAILLSPTEWGYLLRIAEVLDFPMAPPHRPEG